VRGQGRNGRRRPVTLVDHWAIPRGLLKKQGTMGYGPRKTEVNRELKQRKFKKKSGRIALFLYNYVPFFVDYCLP
jgi:hypothetical protein